MNRVRELIFSLITCSVVGLIVYVSINCYYHLLYHRRNETSIRVGEVGQVLILWKFHI